MHRAISTATLVFALAAASCFGGFDQDAEPGPTRKQGAASRPARAPGGKTEPKKPEQSYAAAWRVICDAERRSGAGRSADRAERGARVAAWIVEHLKNRKARYWFIGFGKVKKGRRGYFIAEATRAGQPGCALAALLFDERPASRPTPASQPSAR